MAWASISGTDMQQVAMASWNWFGWRYWILPHHFNTMKSIWKNKWYQHRPQITRQVKPVWGTNLYKRKKISFPIFFRHFLSQREPVVRKKKNLHLQASANQLRAPWPDGPRCFETQFSPSPPATSKDAKAKPRILEEICVVFPCTHCLRVWVYRSKPLSAKVGLIKPSIAPSSQSSAHVVRPQNKRSSSLTLQISSNSAGLTPPSEWTSWDLAASTAAA